MTSAAMLVHPVVRYVSSILLFFFSAILNRCSIWIVLCCRGVRLLMQYDVISCALVASTPRRFTGVIFCYINQKNCSLSQVSITSLLERLLRCIHLVNLQERQRMRSVPLMPHSVRRASMPTSAFGGQQSFDGPLSGDEMVPIASSTNMWGTRSTPPLWSIGEHGVADGNQAMCSSFSMEIDAQFLPGATQTPNPFGFKHLQGIGI